MNLGSVSAQIEKLEQDKAAIYQQFVDTDHQLLNMKTAQAVYIAMATDPTLQAFVGDILMRHGIPQDVIQAIWDDANGTTSAPTTTGDGTTTGGTTTTGA